MAQRPRQRPFYHVSEEEYRCSMQILRHFLPQDDLNLETLRSIAKELNIGNSPAQDTLKSSSAKDSSEHAEGSVSNESISDTEEIGDLHHQMGCLMKDSLGEYREFLLQLLAMRQFELIMTRVSRSIFRHSFQRSSLFNSRSPKPRTRRIEDNPTTKRFISTSKTFQSQASQRARIAKSSIPSTASILRLLCSSIL